MYMGCVCLHYLLCINALTCTDVHDMYLLQICLEIYTDTHIPIYLRMYYITHILDL